MEGHRLILRSRTCRIEFVQEESVHQFNGNISAKVQMASGCSRKLQACVKGLNWSVSSIPFH